MWSDGVMKGLFLTLILIFSLHASARTKPHLLKGFGTNAKESFTENIPWHLSAIGLTPILISSGADARVQNTFQGTADGWFLPGEAVGYLGPFMLGLPLYVVGRSNHNNETIGAAYAVAQTSVITLSTVFALKSFTGRPPPDNSSDVSMQKQSEKFNFGFLNRGIYDGWPSGHMATISSLASTMIYYYPAADWMKVLGYGAMAYTLIGVSTHEQGQFHWFSEGIAGGLMGYAIGKTVGTNMRASVSGKAPPVENKTVEVLPLIGPGTTGAQLVWYQ